MLDSWRARVRRLKIEIQALALAARDPRVPWYARLLALLVAGYALSPIDLIPDFIPLLGHLDDLLLVPLGIARALRLIPPEVLAEHRAAARAGGTQGCRAAAAVIVALWLLLALVAARLLLGMLWR